MKIRNVLRSLPLLVTLTALLLAGCQPAPQAEPAKETADSDTPVMPDETRIVADAALGKQAEILAHGDWARNGTDQVLVVNRIAKGQNAGTPPEDSAGISITRAVILENNNGRWAEILRCDEHLKNRNGYLGGTPSGRITGWRLEYNIDARQGLELKFTPAKNEAGEEGSGMGEPGGQTVVVRWNAGVKRYQSLSLTRQAFLSEAPALETPQSILK